MFQRFKNIYYKYFLANTIRTVHVRGRLSDKEQFVYDSALGKSLFYKLNLISNHEPIILEIGFGNGGHLLDLAISNLDKNVYGVELYEAGIVKVLKEIQSKKLNNLQIIKADARDIIKNLNKESVAQMFILFPDPWPKKRHNKRRLLKIDFIKDCINKLENSGVLYIATDWQEYAAEIEIDLQNLYRQNTLTYSKNISENISNRILKTTFAKRAYKEGRSVTIFEIRK